MASRGPWPLLIHVGFVYGCFLTKPSGGNISICWITTTRWFCVWIYIYIHHLVMTNIANWKIHCSWRFLAGKIIGIWAMASIAMLKLNHQRVYIYIYIYIWFTYIWNMIMFIDFWIDHRCSMKHMIYACFTLPIYRWLWLSIAKCQILRVIFQGT